MGISTFSASSSSSGGGAALVGKTGLRTQQTVSALLTSSDIYFTASASTPVDYYITGYSYLEYNSSFDARSARPFVTVAVGAVGAEVVISEAAVSGSIASAGGITQVYFGDSVNFAIPARVAAGSRIALKASPVVTAAFWVYVTAVANVLGN